MLNLTSVIKVEETYESYQMMPDRKFENPMEILKFLPGVKFNISRGSTDRVPVHRSLL